MQSGKQVTGMLLTIDIGNSDIAFGTFREQQLAATWRFASSTRRTADEYGLLLESALRRHGFSPSDITASIVATTSPQVLPIFEQVCADLFGQQPLLVGPGIKTRMKVRFEPPTDLSGDRIANAVAAYYLYGGGPVVVVDFGTATAFDVVSGKGEYLGGVITPGVKVAAEALVGRTARIPRVELAAPPTAIGRSTATALQSGLVYGHVDMVEGMLRRIQCEVGPARVIATGDLAEQFSGRCTGFDQVIPHLTLQGLCLLHQFNS
jgi:type III pantothenate kinase